MPATKLLRVSFLIDPALLGDFVHAFSDKVIGLEITPVIKLPHGKNMPRASRAEALARRRTLRDLIRDALAAGPMSRDDLVTKLAADHDAKQIRDRKSTRLNSSHLGISYAVFCLKKKKQNKT